MFRMLISSPMRSPGSTPIMAYGLRLAAREFRVQIRRRLPFLLSLVVLSGGTLAGAPVPAPPPAGSESPFGFSDQMSVGYVLVPVVVRTPSGYASNLNQQDFRLLVDGKPVKIQ